MTVGRVTIDGQVQGIGFAIGPLLAVTARHVIKAILDDEDGLILGHDVALIAEDGSTHVADIGRANKSLDIASLVLRNAVTSWLQPSNPMDGAEWRVSSRPRDNDPMLSGHITTCSRHLLTEIGDDVVLLQLHVREAVGDYGGYSGSPIEEVAINGSERRLVGILVEQARWRIKNPDQRLPPVANVLYAVPITAALHYFGVQVPSLDDPEYAQFKIRMEKIRRIEPDAGKEVAQKAREEVVFRYVFGE